MAMAKGFADRSVSIDEVSSKKRLKADKKSKRRETISHELQQLQAAVVPSTARAPLAPRQQGNGSRPSQATSLQQQQSPEEDVASLAEDLQREVLRLQQDVRNSEFFRYLIITSRCMTPWRAQDVLHGSRIQCHVQEIQDCLPRGRRARSQSGVERG